MKSIYEPDDDTTKICRHPKDDALSRSNAKTLSANTTPRKIVEKTDLRLETRNQRFMDMEEEDSDINQLTFSFSSEQPVKRHFGDEVLSHKEGDVDLSRLNTGGLLLLITTEIKS